MKLTEKLLDNMRDNLADFDYVDQSTGAIHIKRPPQFLRLESLTGPGHRHRAEHLVRIDQIRYIRRSSDGYELTLNGRTYYPLTITAAEYDHLINVLNAAGMVTFPAPGSEE